MDFDSFLDQAWSEHASHPALVAERLQSQGQALLREEAQVGALAFLAQHLHGQHLGRWAEGARFQQALAALPLVQADSDTAQTLQRHIHVLHIAAGQATPDLAPSASERTRLAAMSAAALSLHDPARATLLLQQATAGAAALPDADPGVRALAAGANNMAAALEEEVQLDATQKQLMLDAARLARTAWARAGTWLQVERAEYRLALSWLKAGDPRQADVHARQCLALVQAQTEPGAPALEHFFAWEAVGRAARAAGEGAACAEALQQAEAWFLRLAEADAGWCRTSLDALRRLGVPAPLA